MVDMYIFIYTRYKIYNMHKIQTYLTKIPNVSNRAPKTSIALQKKTMTSTPSITCIDNIAYITSINLAHI